MKFNLLKIFVFLFAISVFTMSCDENLLDNTLDEEDLVDNTDSEDADSDVFAIVGDATGGKKAGGCTKITWDNETGYPRTATIDYGNGCIEANKFRKGKITVKLTGPWKTVGSVATATYENYTVKSAENGLKTKIISGTTIITCKAANADTKTYKYEIVTDSKIAQGDKSNAWKGTLEIDAEYIGATVTKVTTNGETTGTTRSGKAYTKEVTNLVKEFGDDKCKYFTAGTMKTTIGEGGYTLDFNTNKCGEVSYKYNGITGTLDLNKYNN